MFKKYTFLLLLLILFSTVIPTIAQDNDSCVGDNLATLVEDAYTLYTRDASVDEDFEASVNSLDNLIDALEAIQSDCDEVRYQAYVDDGIALLDDLRAGGYILYVRHTETDRSQNDTNFSSCETQRNLNQQGRDDAANIGDAWATLNVPIGTLISTQLCRTRETAELAFGEPDIIINRSNFEASELAILLTTITEVGTNTIIVGHIGSIQRVTGIAIPQDSPFAEGDALIYRPTGNDYDLVGHISLQNWFDLARIVAEEE